MSGRRKICSIKVVHLIDDNPDTSFLGDYTDEYDEFHFDREQGRMLRTLEREKDYTVPEKGREYRFFKPYAGGEKPGSTLYIRYGKQDLARMEGLEKGNWCFIGIRADAIVRLTDSDLCQKITSGGIWGVESDCPEYHKDLEKEELTGLRDELKAAGFTDETIDSVEVDYA